MRNNFTIFGVEGAEFSMGFLSEVLEGCERPRSFVEPVQHPFPQYLITSEWAQSGSSIIQAHDDLLASCHHFLPAPPPQPISRSDFLSIQEAFFKTPQNKLPPSACEKLRALSRFQLLAAHVEAIDYAAFLTTAAAYAMHTILSASHQRRPLLERLEAEGRPLRSKKLHYRRILQVKLRAICARGGAYDDPQLPLDDIVIPGRPPLLRVA